jgi:hypothetical protein
LSSCYLSDVIVAFFLLPYIYFSLTYHRLPLYLYLSASLLLHSISIEVLYTSGWSLVSSFFLAIYRPSKCFAAPSSCMPGAWTSTRHTRKASSRITSRRRRRSGIKRIRTSHFFSSIANTDWIYVVNDSASTRERRKGSPSANPNPSVHSQTGSGSFAD